MSFVDALFQRYSDASIDEQLYQLFILGSLSPGKSGNRLILPPSLSLNGCQIKYAGSKRKIRELCHFVEALDLASNDFTSLEEILNIIKEMPNLRFLNLSENDYSKLDENSLKPIQLENMKSLVLNNTGVPFIIVQFLLNSFPNLSHLHLSLNNYANIDIGPKKYSNIKRLYISGNPNLKSLPQIINLLGAFPSLEGLTMADCNVDTIPDNLNQLLPKLQTLNISNWPIKKWECLEKLNFLTNLVELRCQGIEVLQTLHNPDSKRQHLIARLPNIQRLNGSEVTEDERIFAEKSFIRWFLSNQEVSKPERFYSLYNIYGKVEPLAEVDFSPPKNASVKVTYTWCDDDDIDNNDCLKDNKQIQEMKIDLTKSVKEFKLQLSSLFKLPINKMRIFYIDHVMSEVMGPEELKFNQKKLYTYNVQDGDEFLIVHNLESSRNSLSKCKHYISEFICSYC